MISNGNYSTISKDENKKAKSTDEEFSSLDKFNWLIHLQHVTGGIQGSKSLIASEIHRSKGKNEFALYKQGEIFREEGKFQESLESFQACLRLNPGNSDYLKEVGKCLFEMQRYKLAMEAYLEAEKLDNNPVWQIYYYLGQSFLKLGDINKAQEYAQKAVQVGKHEFCYELLIKILMLKGDIKAAIGVSTTAVQYCPDSVKMLSESGLLFLKIGQNEHAFEKLSSALALEPTHSKALLALGCIIQKHEDYDIALSKYKMAIQNEPDSMALWNNIGVCFYAKQKYIAAISCLKRALWLEPLNWRVLFNLALCHLATLQPASAFNYACASVNLRPDVADCFTVLGVTLLELRDPDNAVKAFRLALGLDTDDPYILVNMALCCCIIGLEEQAICLMEQYNRLMENKVVVAEEKQIEKQGICAATQTYVLLELCTCRLKPIGGIKICTVGGQQTIKSTYFKIKSNTGMTMSRTLSITKFAKIGDIEEPIGVLNLVTLAEKLINYLRKNKIDRDTDETEQHIKKMGPGHSEIHDPIEKEEIENISEVHAPSDIEENNGDI